MSTDDGNDGWWQFLRLCTHLKTDKQFNEFFDLFLSSEERKAIGSRCAIVQALLEGEKTQRTIAKDLHLSIAQITRGSNYLKIISDNLRRFLKRHLT